MGKNQHVVKTEGGWGVRGENNTRNTQNFDTQQAAINRAREIAINQNPNFSYTEEMVRFEISIAMATILILQRDNNLTIESA